MEEALRAKLLASTAIAAAVTKVVWGARPDGAALTAERGTITLMVVAPGREYTHAGADDLTAPLVQFDLWGLSQYQCWQIERLVIAEMETASTIGGYAFGPAFLEAQHDMDPEDTDGGVTIFRRVSEWRIYNSPTT